MGKPIFMEKRDIKKELISYIDSDDEGLINALHETALQYQHQKKLDRMIEEGEEDIAAGRVYNLEESQKMLLRWLKK